MFFAKHWGLCFINVLLLLNNLNVFQCEMESKVVGGAYAKIRQYPHAVFLHIICPIDWTCGSSILNQKILLTAAHCVKECSTLKKYNIHAFGGNEDISKNSLVRKVNKIIYHTKYEEVSVENDIALLRVHDNFLLSGVIKRVIISKKFPELQSAIVAGWGIVDEITNEATTRLKSVTQKLRPKRTCAMIGELKASMFCAGSTHEYDSHPAPGDSGSALISSDFKVIGLVSFRIRDIPALMVYTNVSYYYTWIEDKSKELFCPD